MGWRSSWRNSCAGYSPPSELYLAAIYDSKLFLRCVRACPLLPQGLKLAISVAELVHRRFTTARVSTLLSLRKRGHFVFVRFDSTMSLAVEQDRLFDVVRLL